MIRGFLAEYLGKTGDLRNADLEIRQALVEKPRSSQVLYSAAVIAVLARRDPTDLVQRAIDSGLSPKVFAVAPEFEPTSRDSRFVALVSGRRPRE
jgi:hypothetical protein